MAADANGSSSLYHRPNWWPSRLHPRLEGGAQARRQRLKLSSSRSTMRALAAATPSTSPTGTLLVEPGGRAARHPPGAPATGMHPPRPPRRAPAAWASCRNSTEQKAAGTRQFREACAPYWGPSPRTGHRDREQASSSAVASRRRPSRTSRTGMPVARRPRARPPSPFSAERFTGAPRPAG